MDTHGVNHLPQWDARSTTMGGSWTFQMQPKGSWEFTHNELYCWPGSISGKLFLVMANMKLLKFIQQVLLFCYTNVHTQRLGGQGKLHFPIQYSTTIFHLVLETQ